ncbi:MAG: phosphotransferase [Actinomycetota bacterium]
MDNADALLAANDIDADRLGEVLRAGGYATAADAVIAIDASIIGTGQVGENVRCRLTWDPPASTGAEGHRPGSVVVKVPSSSELSRATAAATSSYVREVGFYRDIRPHVAIRTPHAYHVSENREQNDFLLVMEDIAPAAAGDQLAGCSLDEATLAVDTIAGLHGPTWGRLDFAELDWLAEPGPQRVADLTGLFGAVYPGFVERFTPTLTPDELDAGAFIHDRFEAILNARPLDLCLVHGDFRLDNVLFATGPGAPPITTVDWQTVTLGSGPSDVAYFLSAAIDPDARRADERALVERYHQRLTEHGVGIGFDDAWLGYRLGSAAGYIMAVIASQIVTQTERGDAMFATMARGSAHQLIDLDLEGALD